MKRLTKDAENMLEVMERTAERTDIWQDRLIYHMALAIWHILNYLNRHRQIGGSNMKETIEELRTLIRMVNVPNIAPHIDEETLSWWCGRWQKNAEFLLNEIEKEVRDVSQ